MVFTYIICALTDILASEAYNPTSYGVNSMGMGGTGIATYIGAENVFSNPALLTVAKKNEAEIGLIYNIQDTNVDRNETFNYDSSEKTVDPYIAINYKFTQNVNIAIGVLEYRLKNHISDTSGSVNNDIKKQRIYFPVSYKKGDLFIGGSVIYEKLDFSYTVSTSNTNLDWVDGSFGYEAGLAYQFDEFLIACDYKTSITHKFLDSGTIAEINSASELGIGIGWEPLSSNHKLIFEYKYIDSSKSFKEDGQELTKDINVYTFGYSYQTSEFVLRLGYKYVSDLYAYDSETLDFVFPYDITSSYSVGGSYTLNKNFTIDAALSYADYSHETINFEGDAYSPYTVKNNPISLGFAVSYTF